MDKDYLVELTSKIYRLTLSFPKKEPLRYKIREAADEILKNLIIGQASKEEELSLDVSKNINVLMAFLEVAKWQNWASYFNILEVSKEYDRIINNLKKEAEVLEAEETKQEFIPFIETEKAVVKQLDPRKEKILEILKEKGTAQVWEIKKILTDVSKRTLRRDFEKLLKEGFIERMGERNNTFYKLKEELSKVVVS